MATRRSVIQLLGLAPVAAPLAAKAATDAQIAKLAGITLEGAAAAGSYAPSPQGFDDYNKTRIAASEYAKLVGIPDFVKEQLRRNSQYVGVLDPDIAAKRSWSMSVKIATQRQRNYERQLELLQHTGWHARSAMAFKKLTGWDWPW